MMLRPVGVPGDYGFLPPLTSPRAANRARIISLIRRRPGLTRAELSQVSGLSKGTISSVVGELLDEGFLVEDDRDGQRRRKTSLHLNRRAGVAVGIELSPDECRAVLTDTEVRALRHAQRPLASTRVETTVEIIASVTAELLSGIEQRCLGVAIAVPGLTDVAGTTVEFSERLAWFNVPLAQRLAEHVPYRIKVINRPRAGVLGEHWYGAGVGVENLLYLSVSSGVAVGILLGGQLYTGAYGYSGEFGHTTVLPDGPECVCGNRGCLEAIASIPAILQAVTARVTKGEPSSVAERLREGTELSHQDLIGAAQDGDSLVLDEIRRASRYIGIGVANLIDVLNPNCVIIGGRLAEAGEIALSTIRETVQRRAFPASSVNVQIVRNALGLDSVGIGACALVVDQYVAEIEPALQLAP